jgi:hypothetical protein
MDGNIFVLHNWALEICVPEAGFTRVAPTGLDHRWVLVPLLNPFRARGMSL